MYTKDETIEQLNNRIEHTRKETTRTILVHYGRQCALCTKGKPLFGLGICNACQKMYLDDLNQSTK